MYLKSHGFTTEHKECCRMRTHGVDPHDSRLLAAVTDDAIGKVLCTLVSGERNRSLYVVKKQASADGYVVVTGFNEHPLLKCTNKDQFESFSLWKNNNKFQQMQATLGYLILV